MHSCSDFESVNEIRKYIQKSLNSRDVYVQAVLKDFCLLLVFNRQEKAKISYADLTEKLLPFLEERDFLGAEKLVIYGRTLGSEECVWQTEMSLPIAKKSKPLLLALKRYRNAVEPIVASVVHQYIEQDYFILANSEIAQVMAYSLNRFKPMYATSIQGWEIIDSLREEINEQTKQFILEAIEVVRNAPYETSDCLAVKEVQTHAHILAHLNKLLGRKNLRWRDVPSALQYRLQDGQVSRNNKFASQVKSYLKRSSQRDLSTEFLSMADFGMVQMDWFAVYMSITTGAYINGLEPIVFEIMQSQIHARDSNSVLERNFNELMAYTLNRLPSMYATTQRGIEWVREWALENLEVQIEPLVQEALAKFGENLLDQREPMPLDRFEQEAEFAFGEIKQLLKRFDISWENILELIESELLRQAKPQDFS